MKPKSSQAAGTGKLKDKQSKKPAPPGAGQGTEQRATEGQRTEPGKKEPAAPKDPVDEASWESFPASDAPAY